MIDNNRVVIEANIGRLKEIRKAYIEHYLSFDGLVSEERLANILDSIHQIEERITELRKQLPPPMSQRQLRALEEIPKAWAEVTGNKPKEEALCKAADKTPQEYADIAAGRDLQLTAKRFEEAREEHGTPVWKVEHHHSASGDKRFEGALEDVCSIEGQVETARLTITPVRRSFKKWLKSWFI